MHHFDNVGLYDALFVMQDKESKTLWNHITGEAQYGPLVGRKLGPVGNLLQVSVEQALAVDTTTRVAISSQPYFVNGQRYGSTGPLPAADGGRGGRGGAPPGGSADPARELAGMFADTLGNEDTRRPRMELGLGLVTDRVTRFYPMAVIQSRGAFLDRIGDRTVLIFIDPSTFTPVAMYVTATRATVEGAEIRLDTGAVVRRGTLFDARGTAQEPERPQQLFSRWYGFALTFPRPEIYGQ